MRNWYHHLWRLVARATGSPHLPPRDRRTGFRPKVEALEERWVPCGLPPLSFHLTLPPGGAAFVPGDEIRIGAGEATTRAFHLDLDKVGAQPVEGTLVAADGRAITVKILKERGDELVVKAEERFEVGDLVGTIFQPPCHHKKPPPVIGLGGGPGGFGIA